MDDKLKNIIAFVKYHNINRPLEYPLFGLLLISAGCMFLFGRCSISPPDKIEPIFLYIEFFISILLLILGIIIRKKILKYSDREMGKCLYLAQIIMYIYLIIIGLLCVFLIVVFDYGIHGIPIAVIITFVLGVIIVSTVYLDVSQKIKNGYYQNNNNILSEKATAFLSSTACITLFVIIFQFIKRSFNEIGYLFLSMGLVGVSLSLAFIYYLKLKYAKKYGLEEYFPTRPNPSPYTNWE